MPLIEPKDCEFCKKELPRTMRKDAKFCSGICRKKYWEKTGRRQQNKQGKGIKPLKASSSNLQLLKVSVGGGG